jgi:hypothetical protein
MKNHYFLLTAILFFLSIGINAQEVRFEKSTSISQDTTKTFKLKTERKDSIYSSADKEKSAEATYPSQEILFLKKEKIFCKELKHKNE